MSSIRGSIQSEVEEPFSRKHDATNIAGISLIRKSLKAEEESGKNI